MKYLNLPVLVIFVLVMASCSIQEECLSTSLTENKDIERVSVISVRDSLGVLSRIQSNPYVMLISHVSCECGEIVLNISLEESCDLGIDATDYHIVADYVESLNENSHER